MTSEIHYRLIDNGGRWSLYRDDASGTSQPIILDTTERIARVVLAELDPTTADEVLVPAVTVPHGYAEEVRAVAERVAPGSPFATTIEHLVDEIGEGVLGPYFRVWNEGDVIDEVAEHFTNVTGWADLSMRLRYLGGLLFLASGDMDAEGITWEESPTWAVRLRLAQVQADEARRGDGVAGQVAGVLARLLDERAGEPVAEEGAGVGPLSGEEVAAIRSVTESLRVTEDIVVPRFAPALRAVAKLEAHLDGLEDRSDEPREALRLAAGVAELRDLAYLLTETMRYLAGDLTFTEEETLADKIARGVQNLRDAGLVVEHGGIVGPG